MKPKHQNRADETGLTFVVTALPGGWGIRSFRDGKMKDDYGIVSSRDEVGLVIRDALRWLNKLGDPSPMAEASRDRFYCRGKVF